MSVMNKNLTESVQVLFQKAHVEALVNNQKQVSKWQTYKKDLSDVGERLKGFLRDLNVAVMVPIGNKALFRGKLVHTNDIMISLGDGYFVKGSVEQALEIKSRRLVKCDEMLEKLRKERSLLESRALVRTDRDLFSSPDTQDIVEDFVQQEEESWKKEHRKKVRDYKQKLAQMKENDPSEIKTDEDLWKRLELLEMEEELNDELDRLGSDEEDSGSENSEEVSSGESSDETSNNPIDMKSDHPGLNKTPHSSIIKQLSNYDENTLPREVKANAFDDHITINFKHSSCKPEIKEHTDIINSPHDIYNKFSHAIDKKNKKNNRRVSFAENPQIKMFRNEPNEFSDNAVVSRDNREVEDQPVAFGDVVERTIPSEFKLDENRPVSKFKSSRFKQNSK